MMLLELKDVSKVYHGAVPVEALKKIDLRVDSGEFVSIMGPSGSGKTTLLNLIATLDTPSRGELLIANQQPHRLSKDKLAAFRRQELGIVFQQFNLLKTLTVIENIMLPLTLDGIAPTECLTQARKIMIELDISHLANKRIYEISGGEAQRVAIGRALIHQPQLLLADEPTGNLDSKAAMRVMQLFEKLNQEKQITTLMVTHDPVSASYSKRVIFIKDGKFYNELYCGDNREAFYQKILDVLSHLGGKHHDIQTTHFS